MEKQITITREWLEKLIEIKSAILKCENEDPKRASCINYLLGYIASAESLLK